ncbi:putative plasmalemma vesicle-associated protein isoform X1 [Sesbania bispinosa]|nr:putative plasmalemma vesicle-associated protein isoform X1 [Sesbania bispinosa]
MGGEFNVVSRRDVSESGVVRSRGVSSFQGAQVRGHGHSLVQNDGDDAMRDGDDAIRDRSVSFDDDSILQW